MVGSGASDNDEIGRSTLRCGGKTEGAGEFVASAARNREAAGFRREPHRNAPALQQSSRHIARGDQEIIELPVKAQRLHTLCVGLAGEARIGEDDDPHAPRLERGQRIFCARILASSVVQDAILIEENRLEAGCEREETRQGAYRESLRRRSARRATPTQAWCESACLRGAGRLRRRILAQAAFTAPPPTVRTERSSGAPSSASLR